MNDAEESVLYGLTGYPLGHSFSKTFFTDKFRAEGLGAEYRNFPLQELNRESIVRLATEHPELRGLNVTAPHKRAAYALADYRTAEAEAAQAANTLLIRRSAAGDGLLIEAHNTDIEGFREALRPYLDKSEGERRAFVCGSGGAGEAVRIALRQLGIESRTVSRNPDKTERAISYADLCSLLGPRDIIVNATPIGTWPATEGYLPLPYEQLGPDNIFADLVYNPAETTMMRMASEAGATAFNGRRMLELQALASYKFWNQL
ncbi:MAG: shikimate dehydrogenase [Muribaculaceae bacterium]|nr:shikimate dehydrogenase [Muribaculaceae bacterium]